MTLSVTTDFTAGTAIVASEVNQNFTDVENYVNSSPGLLAKTGGTLSGGFMSAGISGSGYTQPDTKTNRSIFDEQDKSISNRSNQVSGIGGASYSTFGGNAQ